MAGIEDTFANARLAIRPFAPDDAAAVDALFAMVKRQLAPGDMADLFEDDIARSVAEGIADTDRDCASCGGGLRRFRFEKSPDCP